MFITDTKRKAAVEKGSEEPGLGVLLPVHAKHTSAPSTSMDTPASAATSSPFPELGKCVMCRRLEPKRRLKSCAKCGMVAHQGCIGFEDAAIEAKTWLCDLCQNDQDPESALLPHCVLCDEAATDRNTQGMLNALDVYKPTECNNWVHLVCATWVPEVLYGDITTMRPVEGVGSLPLWRYTSPCSLCNETRGAVVVCAEPACRTRFHVSCAYQAQPACTLAFEIFPVKTSRRESVNTLTFKSETGHMVAQIWCKQHRNVAKSKTTYDFYESDAKLGLTAMQAYARTHKQVVSTSLRNSAVIESSHALLRRAKRLDAILQDAGAAGAYVRDAALVTMTMPVSEANRAMDEAAAKPAPPPPTCLQCHTDWTPLWWPVPGGAAMQCSTCHAARRPPPASA